MKYNLSNELDVVNFKNKAKLLIENGKIVELTEKRKRRTLSQNNYLHLILSWFGVETGYTLEQVKQDIFKRHICKELFLSEKNGILICKSTKDLNTKELTQAIDKFRNWSSSEMNIYLPNANEKNMLDDIESRLGQFKKYL